MSLPDPQTPTTGDEPRRPTVADHVLDRMASWGRRYSGYPGDGVNGVTAALQRRTDELRFVQVRHEETAGFAAAAHVKYGGGPIGAALVTSGPPTHNGCSPSSTTGSPATPWSPSTAAR